jgi:hypothetical protein
LLVQFQTVRDHFFGGLKPKSCSWSLSLCCRWSQWMSSLLFMFKCVLRRLIEWHWVLFSVCGACRPDRSMKTILGKAWLGRFLGRAVAIFRGTIYANLPPAVDQYTL